MPAWQKRQPRAQPRMTSSARRSCTGSMTGTSRPGGGYGVEVLQHPGAHRARRRPRARRPSTARSRARISARAAPPAALSAGDRCRRPPAPTSSPSPRQHQVAGTAPTTAGFMAQEPPATKMGSPSPRSRGRSGDAGQVDHGQQVGVGQLVAQGEAHQVEGARRPSRGPDRRAAGPRARMAASMSGQGAKARSQKASSRSLQQASRGCAGPGGTCPPRRRRESRAGCWRRRVASRRPRGAQLAAHVARRARTPAAGRAAARTRPRSTGSSKRRSGRQVSAPAARSCLRLRPSSPPPSGRSGLRMISAPCGVAVEHVLVLLHVEGHRVVAR